MKVFVLFPESQLKFFGLWAEKKQGRQNSSLYVQKTFWGNQVEWETYSFDYRSRTYSGIHSDFSWKKKTKSVVMTTLCVQLIVSRKIMFLRNNVFFRNKFGLWAKILDFSWQTHGMVARTAFYAQ